MIQTGKVAHWALSSRRPPGLFCLVLMALSLASAVMGAAPQRGRTAVVLHLDGVIGPASADYLARGLAKAQADGAEIVVLRLDTPGGLNTSMRDVIRAIIASPVPVAAHVGPGGARAASAGTYIVYASHLATMAPGTNLGAATPIQLALPGMTPPESPARDGSQDPRAGPEPGAKPSDAPTGAPPVGNKMEAKAINDAVAYIRALANLRSRNADWAEQAVRDAASLDAGEAAKAGVIDFVARDVTDVLAQADGRAVLVNGARVTLNTRGLAVREIRADWRYQLLATITNPNVALIFMMVGIYGLIFEFMNPGALYPGTIGAISLLIGLYALAVLPVNYAGLALILLGIGLIVGEAFAPSFGILGIGGIGAFLLGGVILIDTDAPGFGVSLPLLGGLALASLGFTLLVVRLALTSRRRRVVSGREQMIGGPGVVQDWSNSSGHVLTHSERWRAVSSTPLRPGDQVRTVAINDLTLSVEPAGDGAQPLNNGDS